MAWYSQFKFKLDRLNGFHHFEVGGGAEFIQIKSLPVIPDVYAGWMHKNATDEQRRQKSIWSYIMALTSAHNTVDNDGKWLKPCYLLYFGFSVTK